MQPSHGPHVGVQAASSKQQAASSKQQAASSKQQAARRRERRASGIKYCHATARGTGTPFELSGSE